MEDQVTKIDDFINSFNKKQRSYVDLVENLNSILYNFQNTANDAYHSVSERIDMLNREMTTRANAINDKVSNLNVKTEKGINESTSLGILVKETKEHLLDISNYFLSIRKNDEKIFNEIKYHIAKVDDVKTSIQNVEELSTDIEILAFNAMIVAAKAGVEGLAFSCITDELKNISNQTLLIVTDLMHQEKDLFNHYNRFQQSITEIENLQEKTSIMLSTDINEEFEKLLEGVLTIGSLSSESLTEFDRIKPVFDQLKNILEQKKSIPVSIDIIHHALKRIEENKEELHLQDEYQPDCILQLLVGQTKVSKISSRLFSDIEQYISLTTDLLNSKYNIVKKNADSMAQSHGTLIDFFIDSEGQFGVSSLGALFSDCTSAIKHVIDLVNMTIDDKQKISETGEALIGHIESLEEQFQFLTKTAKKFNLINISSKIEIAKRKVLSNHGNISDKIEEITEEIGNTLFKTYDQLVLIKKSTQQLLSQFNINLLNQRDRSKNFVGLVEIACNKYDHSEKEIRDLISSFTLFSERFQDLIRTTTADVNEIRKLKIYPEKASKIFNEINKIMEGAKSYLLDLSKMNEDDVPVPYYNEIFQNIEEIENKYKEFENNYTN